MTGIQILIIVIAAFAIIRSLIQLRKSKVTIGRFIPWVLLWIAVIVAVALPQTTQVAASILGVGRGVDVVTYVSIAVLLLIVYRLFVKIEELEREITTLVRKVALNKKEENNV